MSSERRRSRRVCKNKTTWKQGWRLHNKTHIHRTKQANYKNKLGSVVQTATPITWKTYVFMFYYIFKNSICLYCMGVLLPTFKTDHRFFPCHYDHVFSFPNSQLLSTHSNSYPFFLSLTKKHTDNNRKKKNRIKQTNRKKCQRKTPTQACMHTCMLVHRHRVRCSGTCM